MKKTKPKFYIKKAPARVTPNVIFETTRYLLGTKPNSLSKMYAEKYTKDSPVHLVFDRGDKQHVIKFGFDKANNLVLFKDTNLMESEQKFLDDNIIHWYWVCKFMDKTLCRMLAEENDDTSIDLYALDLMIKSLSDKVKTTGVHRPDNIKTHLVKSVYTWKRKFTI